MLIKICTVNNFEQFFYFDKASSSQEYFSINHWLYKFSKVSNFIKAEVKLESRTTSIASRVISVKYGRQTLDRTLKFTKF